jgi:hypothetical protein
MNETHNLVKHSQRRQMGAIISNGFSKSYVVEEFIASPGTLWSIVTDVEAMPQYISAIKDVNVLGSTYDENGSAEQENRSDQPSKKSSCRWRRTDPVASSKTGLDSVGAYSSCTLDTIRTLKEGFTWEEIRYIRRSERKILKRVTSVGLKTRVTNIYSDPNGSPVNVIRHQQKYLRINAKLSTQTQNSLETMTYTIIIGWDEIGNHDENERTDRRSNMDATESSTNNSKAPVISLLPKKCQLMITMAYIPNSILARLALIGLDLSGFNRINNRVFQNEVDEILMEAERREKCQRHQ